MFKNNKINKNNMEKRGINNLDVLIWIGIILILGWAILKALGIIHSPIWVDMIPYFGVGASAIGGAYKLGKIMTGIEETKVKVDKILNLEEDFKEVKNNQKMCMEGKLHNSPYKRR